MSLILEALRKSEAERRRGLAPDVAMELPPIPATRLRTPPAWVLPVVVVATLLVLAVWWARPEPAATISPAPATENTTDATTSPSSSVPKLMPRIAPRPGASASAELPAPTAQSLRPGPGQASPLTPIVAAPPIIPVQPIPPKPRPAPTPLPPASDISNDSSSLPPIKLSMLMWDEVASKRFVILNGQRMAEGDHSGVVSVIAIERNGVVLESNGSRVRVPLP